MRLIDADNNQVGIVEKYIAMQKALEASLDLVEVSPFSDPPVCRIMDFGKWLYEEKRKNRESHKKSVQHSQTLKEIRLRPETDKHDLDIKLKHAREFLAKGHKVQFTMLFRGRQMLHKERGYEVMTGIMEQLEDVAKVDRSSKMAHRRMTMLVAPIK